MVARAAKHLFRPFIQNVASQDGPLSDAVALFLNCFFSSAQNLLSCSRGASPSAADTGMTFAGSLTSSPADVSAGVNGDAELVGIILFI